MHQVIPPVLAVISLKKDLGEKKKQNCTCKVRSSPTFLKIPLSGGTPPVHISHQRPLHICHAPTVHSVNPSKGVDSIFSCATPARQERVSVAVYILVVKSPGQAPLSGKLTGEEEHHVLASAKRSRLRWNIRQHDTTQCKEEK